jgi:tetratricopeptide (TPR) repeat protein
VHPVAAPAVQEEEMSGNTLKCGVPWVSVIALASLVLAGCAPAEEEAAKKIPVTTSSPQALEFYLQGRDLVDKLRITDSRSYFLEAVAEDESFATAHLALANTAPTQTELFDALEHAIAVADEVSEGERLMIGAREAQAKGEGAVQRERLEALVAAYPADERGHALLGNYHLLAQQHEQAIEQYEAAIEIAPDFSAPYNGMGYAYRFLGRYAEAEQAFKKYIELIPDEPNPYDSYAELLMKMGRFEESIRNYEKALSYNPNFMPSHVGIGNDYLFVDRPDKARDSFQRLLELARDDRERRQARLWMAASYVHEMDRERALEQMRASYAIAEAGDDPVAMSADLVRIGDILLYTGSAEQAGPSYREAVDLVRRAELPQEVKEGAERNLLYNESRVALALGDLDAARRHAEEYRARIEARGMPAETRRSHELAGRIALQEKDWRRALAEFEQADQQNPIMLCLMAKAWQELGDETKARDLVERAANFNAIAFNYAFVRSKACKMLEELQ